MKVQAVVRGGDVHDVVVVTGCCVLGHWLATLIRELCGLAGIAVVEGGGDDLPDLGRGEGPPRILLTTALSRRHIDAVEAGTVRLLGVLDDPVDSVRYTRLARDFGFLQAVQLQTRIAATHHLFLDNPQASILSRRFDGTAHQLAGSLAQRLGAAPGQAALQGLLEAVGGPLDQPWTLEGALEARVPHYLPLDRVADAMSGEEAAIVRQVVSPLVLAALSRDIGTITWTSKVFFFGDRPNEIAPPVADVTGAARIIFYGPYFHLPPGTWKCRLVVAFSEEVRGTQFGLILFCQSEPIAKVLLRPHEGGAFEGFFTARHRFPERPLEIHFQSDEGTIEGHVALGQITYTLLG